MQLLCGLSHISTHSSFFACAVCVPFTLLPGFHRAVLLRFQLETSIRTLEEKLPDKAPKWIRAMVCNLEFPPPHTNGFFMLVRDLLLNWHPGIKCKLTIFKTFKTHLSSFTVLKLWFGTEQSYGFFWWPQHCSPTCFNQLSISSASKLDWMAELRSFASQWLHSLCKSFVNVEV